MQDLTGKDIGRYPIIKKLGQGGMAVVYHAFDTRLERDVALKFIRIEAFSPEVLARVLKRFEREAKTLAKLSHSSIVKIYDYGEYEGAPYLVMELFDGGSLKDYLGKPMPFRQAVNLLLPVARGLAYAHKLGILHRDVKPSNILINQQSGEVVLTDFGIAKLLEDNQGQTLTGTGVGVGTPEYMAPEQGLGKTIDGRADVYALGIVFYELVTGRKPFQAETPLAVLYKQMNDPLPRPKDLVADLIPEVEQVLLKALAKDPQNRYENMDDFVLALEKLLRTQNGTLIIGAKTNKYIKVKNDKTTQDNILINSELSNRKKFPKYIWIFVVFCLITIFMIYNFVNFSDSSLFSIIKITQTNRYTNTSTPIISFGSTLTLSPKVTSTISVSRTQQLISNESPTSTEQNKIAITNSKDSLIQVYEQNFQDPINLNKWSLGDFSTIQDGFLIINGQGDWNGSIRDASLSDQEGVIVLFKFSEKTEAEIYLESGSWEQKGLRRWGIYCRYYDKNWITANNYTDYSTGVNGIFSGNLELEPDTWYYLLFIIGGENKFVGRIWNPENPEKYLESEQVMGETWGNRYWRFHANVYNGEIQIDDYLEITSIND